MPFLLEENLGQQVPRAWDYMGFHRGGKAHPGPSLHLGQEWGSAGHQGSPSPWHHALPGHGLRPHQDKGAGPAWWDSMTRQGAGDQSYCGTGGAGTNWPRRLMWCPCHGQCAGKLGWLSRDSQGCQYLRALTLTCTGQSKGRQTFYGCCCAASHALCLSTHLP